MFCILLKVHEHLKVFDLEAIHKVVLLTASVTSPPQSYLGRVRHYPHIRECTLPLHVLAVACTVRNEVLRNIQKCRGSVMRCPGVAEHYGTLGVLRDITGVCGSSYGKLWNRYRKY